MSLQPTMVMQYVAKQEKGSCKQLHGPPQVFLANI